MSLSTNTPKPPYYAVIFTSVRSEGDNGYNAMSDKIEKLVREQPGYLGMESARSELGITVCYWEDIASIQNWARNAEHNEAKELGRSAWYAEYRVRICKVEMEY